MSSSNGSRVKAIARIDVMLKPEISDPQGQTVSRALPSLGWESCPHCGTILAESPE